MSNRLPLDGITVIELGHSVAAPYAGEILGDLGADVIKIEKADGDDARNWAPPYWGDMSSTFQSLNRNKRSAIVNLKHAAERERLANADPRACGCRHSEFAARLGGGVRARCRNASCAQARAHLLHHRRVRGERPAQGSSRLRSLDAGLRRHHERDRRTGTASGPRRHLDHRHGGRHVVGDRRALRAVAAPRQRRRARRSTLRCIETALAGCAITPPISRLPASCRSGRARARR